MSSYKFRLRLNNETFFGQIRNWREFFPTIRKNERYRTNIPSFSLKQVSFVKEAKDYIDTLKSVSGALTNITCAIDIYRNGEWQDFINGKLAIDRFSKNETETLVGIDPENLITKWLTNDEVELNLTELEDLDGEAITAFGTELEEVTLPSQVIGLFFEAQTLNDDEQNLAGSDSLDEKFRLGAFTVIKDENPDETYALSCGWDNSPDYWVDMSDPLADYTNEVTYDIDYDLGLSSYDLPGEIHIDLILQVLRNDNNAVVSETTVASDSEALTGTSHNLSGNFSGSFDFDQAGGPVDSGISDSFPRARVYLRVYTVGSLGSFSWGIGVEVNNLHIKTNKYSSSTDTQCKGMLVYEAAVRMLQKITGVADPLRSPLLGRTDSELHTYDIDGAASLILYTNGRLVRQFPESEFPLRGQFYEFIKCINAEFNIGVGVIEEDGQRYICIDDIGEFYRSSSQVITLVDPSDITDEIATEYLFNELLAGSINYEAETKGTLSSPHGLRNYTTALTGVVKNSYDFRQPGVTNGALIEALKRDPYEDGSDRDNKYDLSPILICLKRDGMGGYAKETGADLEEVTGVEKAETHFNLRITPGQSVARHAKWFLNGIADSLASAALGTIRFQSGVGNLEATTKLTDVTLTVYENVNLYSNALDAPRLRPNRRTFEFPLTEEQMLSLMANPNQAINVEYKGETLTFFPEVIDLENLQSNLAKFELIQSHFTNI
ncbi:MAG: hypothetical protein ABJL71_19040 [Cyclobacteriaceae bacterium]